jgi:hypothetical protein
VLAGLVNVLKCTDGTSKNDGSPARLPLAVCSGPRGRGFSLDPQRTWLEKAEHQRRRALTRPVLREARGATPRAYSPARFDKLKVRVYGSTAIANGIVEASDSPEVKLRKTIFTDVFVYRDNRWQAVNAQENEIGNGR